MALALAATVLAVMWGAGLTGPVLDVVAFVAMLLLVVVAHEAGHASAARFLGFRHVTVILGKGPGRRHCSLAGVRVVLRGLPVLGFTRAVYSLDTSRARLLVYLLAGPVVNALLLAGAAWLWTPGQDSMGSLHASLADGVQWSTLFVGANLWVLLRNLFPCTLATGEGSLETDGLQVWRLLTGAGIAAGGRSKVPEAVQELLGGKALLVDALEEALRLRPGDAHALQARGAALVMAADAKPGDLEEGLELLTESARRMSAPSDVALTVCFIGLCMLKMDRWEAAVRAEACATGLDPRNHGLAHLRKALQESDLSRGQRGQHD